MGIGGMCPPCQKVAIAVASILPFSHESRAAEICGVRFESPPQIEILLKQQRGLERTIEADEYYGYVENGGLTYWLFTNARNPAHPSVTCRRAVLAGGTWRMKTHTMCRADKRKCDAMVAQFRQLDEQVKKDIERRLKPKQ